MKMTSAERIDRLTLLPKSLTVCSMIDESGDEQEISELMIRRACDRMDADQIWPFASDTLLPQMRTITKTSADILPFRRPS